MSAASLRRFLVLLPLMWVLSLGGVPHAGALTNLSFAPAATYLTGTNGGPFSDENLMVGGVFRTNSRPDLLIANFWTPGVTMLLNNGDGTFQSPSKQITVGANIGTIVTGDFNRDGCLDFAATSSTTVYIMLGDCKGGFSLKASYSLSQTGQTDAAAVDLTGNGILDLVVLTGSQGVATFLGNGDGTFKPGPTTALPTFSTSGLAIAHCVSGKATPDLYVSDAGMQVVYALRGNGYGSFTLSGTGATALVPGSVLAGRFRNGSGVDDAVALNEASAPGMSMAYLQSNGACGFAPATYYNAGFNIDSGDVGDFLNNGNLDIVSSDTSTSREVVLLGNGQGGFSQGGAWSVSPGTWFPQTPVVDDLNGDGKADIATVNVNSTSATSVSVLINTSS
jgi:hypothetical protein